MNTTPIFPGFESLVKPFKFPASPYEYKVTALRECPTPETLQVCDTPDRAADYWKLHIASHPHFNPDCECLAVLLLNTRRKVKGHHLVSLGTMDTILVHPREVFRVAIVTAASALVVMHNHPSGESTPSEADIKVTRDLIRAGQLLKMDVLDHVIMGNGNRASLREQLDRETIIAEGLAPGITVTNIHVKYRESFVISSIQPDLLVYFKGGNGKKAYARSLRRVIATSNHCQ